VNDVGPYSDIIGTPSKVSAADSAISRFHSLPIRGKPEVVSDLVL
jgi:hypothetical protein